MIAVDTSLLVYAHRPESPFHAVAADLVDGLRRSPAPWAIPWPCVHEFLAIVTHPKIFSPPTPIDRAFAAVDAWAAGGNLHFLSEGDGYLDKLRPTVLQARLKGPRIHDARIAAICLHHGIRELLTADRDFSSFARLRTRNPLAAA